LLIVTLLLINENVTV